MTGAEGDGEAEAAGMGVGEVPGGQRSQVAAQ